MVNVFAKSGPIVMNLSASNLQLDLTRPLVGNDEIILTPAALSFLAELADKFTPELEELLAARKRRQLEFDQGAVPGFDPDTADIRDGVWKVLYTDADHYPIQE